MQEDINAFFLHENYPNSIFEKLLGWTTVSFCFDHLFFFVLVVLWPGCIPEPQWYGLACFSNASTSEVATKSCNRECGLFSFVTIIGWELASATVLKLKITLTRASRSCLHINNSSLSSQLYYNSVHCDIQKPNMGQYHYWWWSTISEHSTKTSATQSGPQGCGTTRWPRAAKI